MVAVNMPSVVLPLEAMPTSEKSALAREAMPSLAILVIPMVVMLRTTVAMFSTLPLPVSRLCLKFIHSDSNRFVPFPDAAGKGGVTQSGIAVGGNGKGGGGSALSGSTGSSDGGYVYNSGNVVVNGYQASKSSSLSLCSS